MNQRAFTIVMVPLILALGVVGLGITLALQSAPPPGAASAYSQGKQVGAIVGPVVIAGFFLLLASTIAEKRSRAMASWTIGPILLLMNVAYFVNVMGWARPVPKPARGSNIARIFGDTAASPASQQPIVAATPPTADPSLAPAPPPPRAPRPADSTPQKSPPPISDAVTPPTPSVTAPAVTSPPPAAEAPSEPETADFSEVASYLGRQTPHAKETLDTFAQEAQAAITEVEALGKALFESSLTVPAHDRKVLAERRTRGTQLRAAAGRASVMMQTTVDILQKRLAAAGVSKHEQLSLAVEFSQKTRTSSRWMSAQQLGDAAEDLMTEASKLDEKFGKWKLDKQKKIATEDFALRADISGPRVRLEALKDRKDELMSSLLGQ